MSNSRKNGARGPTNSSGSATSGSEHVQILMSGFLDGELTEQETEALFEAIDRDPALAAELEAMASVMEATGAADPERQLSGATPAGVDLADAVMAAVAPEEVSETDRGAMRLASMAVDDELVPAGASRLDELLFASEDAVGALLHTSEAVGAACDGAANHPGLGPWLGHIPDEVVATVEVDARLRELSMAAVDGELESAELGELSAILEAPGAHGAYRRDLVSAALATSEALRVSLSELTEAPEAARAGAAALQAIAAAELAAAESASKTTAVVAPARTGLLQRLADRFGDYGLPFVFAGAAAVVFFAFSDSGPAAEDQFLAQVEQDLIAQQAEQRLALADDDLELIDYNRADVETIDTDSSSTAVFETRASNITVIWVSEAGPGTEDADDATLEDLSDDEDEVKGT